VPVACQGDLICISVPAFVHSTTQVTL